MSLLGNMKRRNVSGNLGGVDLEFSPESHTTADSQCVLYVNHTHTQLSAYPGPTDALFHRLEI